MVVVFDSDVLIPLILPASRSTRLFAKDSAHPARALTLSSAISGPWSVALNLCETQPERYSLFVAVPFFRSQSHVDHS